MAKKPQNPGKALGGGTSCFQPDGTYTKNGCDALRLAAKKLAAATSKIQSITEDRDAWLKDYPTLKGKEREQRAVQIVDAITGLKQYRAEKLKYGGTLGRIVAGLDAGQFNTEMSPKEIVEQAREGGGREDEDDEDGGEEEGGSDQTTLTFTRNGAASCGAGWQENWKAYPQIFGEREWGVCYAHVSKLHDLKLGTMAVGTPAALARYIRGMFKKLKSTKDRMEILPHAPEWFLDALRELLARHAVCELNGKGEVGAEKAAAEMFEELTAAFDADPDAFLHIAGGKNSLLEMTINRAGKKAAAV